MMVLLGHYSRKENGEDPEKGGLPVEAEEARQSPADGIQPPSLKSMRLDLDNLFPAENDLPKLILAES